MTNEAIAREAAKRINTSPSADSYRKNVQIILAAIEKATKQVQVTDGLGSMGLIEFHGDQNLSKEG